MVDSLANYYVSKNKLFMILELILTPERTIPIQEIRSLNITAGYKLCQPKCCLVAADAHFEGIRENCECSLRLWCVGQ
jgi:hypothetical protein